ncbi:MAG: MmcQ/YjbR family DNA-binding protein [Oscillospiraceae bacterium]|nr:MmcQ/YjbR family DNA-binding protein [Oscillospiraceae bacterium]
MAIDIDSIFRYKTPNREKLFGYGFDEYGGRLEKQVLIMQKQFRLLVIIQPDGAISCRVIDAFFEEEYALVNAEGAQGGFVAEVRSACEQVLTDIAQQCFDTEILKAEQTKRVLAVIRSKYGVQPEFLWDKFPDCAAFRRQDNKKWFAALMAIDRSKIGLAGFGNIEIMDLKAEPQMVEKLLQQAGYYPAYHMNKKHWFTVCLDGSVSDETLFLLIESSFICTGKK